MLTTVDICMHQVLRALHVCLWQQQKIRHSDAHGTDGRNVHRSALMLCWRTHQVEDAALGGQQRQHGVGAPARDATQR